MERVDFKQCKLVPLASVLSHYKIEVKRNGKFLVAKKCPLPSHTSEETNTFKVSMEQNYWVCFSESCRAALGKNGGDSIDFVKAKEGLTNLEAAKRISELFCLTSVDRQKSDIQPTTLSGDRHMPDICNKPLGFTLPTTPEHEMIQSRGISIETTKEFGVGYYEDRRQGTASMHERIIFPLMEDGNLVGYIGRAIRDDQEPRWKIGAKHKTMLFGLERCDPTKPLILCESCWAVLWFAERGRQCAAMMGSELTDAQIQRLAPFDVITLAMDGDMKGREAASKIADRLKGKKIIKAFLKEG